MSVHFDVSPDDRRFLFLRRASLDGEDVSRTVLVQHWLADVKERMKGAR